MASRALPRNRKLPEGISLLRQLNGRANALTINLGLGKPEEDMPARLRSLASEVMQKYRLDYTENAGDLSTRDALAAKLSLSSGKSLILTHGAQEALMMALMGILNPGDEVLVPDPGFLSYPTMVKMLQGKPVAYFLQKKQGVFRHDLKAIKDKISSRTKAIIISSPGNPTGCDFSESELQELLKITERRRILILSDEVYGMLHFSRPYLPLAQKHERVISINSFSKSHALTGWRIGFLASENSEVLQSTLIAHQYIATCASVPAQRLLGKLLQTDLYDSIQSEYRSRYQNKLELFYNLSSEKLKAKTAPACGGFYLFPELPARKKSILFCDALLKKENVLAVPGSIFGKKGEGHIRLSLALPDVTIRKAVEILNTFY